MITRLWPLAASLFPAPPLSVDHLTSTHGLPVIIFILAHFNTMDPATQRTSDIPEDGTIYVGNLSPRVTEYMLTEVFAVAGPVSHVKIIPDRNVSS